MIYFIRHGECVANAENVFAGQRNDSPLTEKGRAQARETGQRILEQGLAVQQIVSSPLSRTKDTAEIIADIIGFDKKKIQLDQRLVEYDMGSLTGTSRQELTSAQLIAPPDAEDVIDFQRRVMSAMKELAQLPGNTLLVSHAGVGRVIEGTRLGKDPKEFYDLPAYPNGSLTPLVID